MEKYNTFIGKNIQVKLKVGSENLGLAFNIGDEVSGMKDGIYLGLEGAVIVENSKVALVTDKNQVFSLYKKTSDKNYLTREQIYNIRCLFNEFTSTITGKLDRNDSINLNELSENSVERFLKEERIFFEKIALDENQEYKIKRIWDDEDRNIIGVDVNGYEFFFDGSGMY